MGIYADPESIKTGDLVRGPYSQGIHWNIWEDVGQFDPIPAIEAWKRGWVSHSIRSDNKFGIVISVVANDRKSATIKAPLFGKPYGIYEWAVWVLLGDKIILTSLAYIATYDEDEPF